MNKAISAIFSIPSLVVHVLICIAWFAQSWSINLFTNLLSIEAILLTLMVGITQQSHHEILKAHLKKGRRK